jgi:hypothetical protein
MRLGRWAPVAALVAVLLGACGGPSPAPTLQPAATAATAPTAAPAVTAAPTVDPATSDVQDAFLTNVNDLTSDVETLATASCDDLTAETRDNPTEVTEIRGFAATLQRVGSTQAMLQSDDVRAALDTLGKAMTQLDAALNTCGIKQP